MLDIVPNYYPLLPCTAPSPSSLPPGATYVGQTEMKEAAELEQTSVIAGDSAALTVELMNSVFILKNPGRRSGKTVLILSCESQRRADRSGVETFGGKTDF